MRNEYIFSYFRPLRTSNLVRRPWWAIFGRDRIEYRDVEIREYKVVTEYVGKQLESLLNGLDLEVAKALLPAGAHSVQLELAAPKTEYVSTPTCKVNTGYSETNMGAWAHPQDTRQR